MTTQILTVGELRKALAAYTDKDAVLIIGPDAEPYAVGALTPLTPAQISTNGVAINTGQRVP